MSAHRCQMCGASETSPGSGFRHEDNCASILHRQPTYDEGYKAGLAAGRAEVAADTRDAERYRYMRSNTQFRSMNGPGLYWYLPRYLKGGEAEQLDAAIDAALATK